MVSLSWLLTAALAVVPRALADMAADDEDFLEVEVPDSGSKSIRRGFLDGSITEPGLSQKRQARLWSWIEKRLLRLRAKQARRYAAAVRRGEDPEPLPERTPVDEMTDEEILTELRELAKIQLVDAEEEAAEKEEEAAAAEEDPDATEAEIEEAEEEAAAAEDSVAEAEEEVEKVEELSLVEEEEMMMSQEEVMMEEEEEEMMEEEEEEMMAPAPAPADEDAEEEYAEEIEDAEEEMMEEEEEEMMAPAPAPEDEDVEEEEIEEEDEEDEEEMTAPAPAPEDEDVEEEEIEEEEEEVEEEMMAPAPAPEDVEDEEIEEEEEEDEEEMMAPAPAPEDEDVEEEEIEETQEEEEEDEEEMIAPAPAPEEEEMAEEDEEETPNPDSESGCTAPSTLGNLEAVLEVSKFSAPTSSDQVDNLIGYCSQYFFLTDDGYARFTTPDERSELRIPSNNGVDYDGFVVEEATTALKGTLRIVNPEISEDDNYTFMQVHGKDTSWIRLAHYGRKNVEGDPEDAFNHMWLFIKEGSSSSSDLTSLSMGPVPDGNFDASIEMPGDGTVTISAGDYSKTFEIKWSDKLNYFKAGVYVQDGPPSEFLVDYKSLSYTISGGENHT